MTIDRLRAVRTASFVGVAVMLVSCGSATGISGVPDEAATDSGAVYAY